MSDLRLDTDFFRHPKSVKLCRRHGAEGVLSLLRLWSFAAANRPTGALDGLDSEDLEIAAAWTGSPGEFVKTLLELRFLEQNDGAFRLHNWERRQPWLATAPVRQAKARAAAAARWNQRARVSVSVSAPDPDPRPDPDPDADTEGEPSRPAAEDALRPEDLAEAWNEHCAPLGLSAVRELSASRRKKALLRLGEHPRAEWWSAVFANIRASPFLRGLKGGSNGSAHPGWRATFDWLIENDTNGVKVFEGKYNE